MKNSKKLFLLFFIVSCAIPSATLAMGLPPRIEPYIKKGKTKALAHILETGEFDPNEELLAIDPKTGKNKLFLPIELAAVKYQNQKSVTFLLENGADICKVPRLLGKALFYSVSPEIVELLINHHADMNHMEPRILRKQVELAARTLELASHDLPKQEKVLLGSCNHLLIHGYDKIPQMWDLFSPEEKAEIEHRHEWAVQKEKQAVQASMLAHTPFPTALVDLTTDYHHADHLLFHEQEYLAAYPEKRQDRAGSTGNGHKHRNCVIS